MLKFKEQFHNNIVLKRAKDSKVRSHLQFYFNKKEMKIRTISLRHSADIVVFCRKKRKDQGMLHLIRN